MNDIEKVYEAICRRVQHEIDRQERMIKDESIEELSIQQREIVFSRFCVIESEGILAVECDESNGTIQMAVSVNSSSCEENGKLVQVTIENSKLIQVTIEKKDKSTGEDSFSLEKKAVVNVLLRAAKNGDVMFWRNCVILKKNESLENLLVEYDLREEND